MLSALADSLGIQAGPYVLPLILLMIRDKRRTRLCLLDLPRSYSGTVMREFRKGRRGGDRLFYMRRNKLPLQAGGLFRLWCCSMARCAAAISAETPGGLSLPHGRAVIDSQRLFSLFLVSRPFESAGFNARNFIYVNAPECDNRTAFPGFIKFRISSFEKGPHVMKTLPPSRFGKLEKIGCGGWI